jgi:hypothetical protein
MSRTSSRFLSLLFCCLFASVLQGMVSHQAFAGGRGDNSAVLFVARDYGFDGPAHIPAGVTTLQVVNKGQDLHHVQLLKLLQGKTAADFRAALKANPAGFPAWIKFVGGPNAEPKAGVTITQADYHFALSSGVTAGTHTIRVINHGTQPHEVVLVKLAPGAAVTDFAAAFEPGASGPPPGMPVGGVVGIETGDHAYFTSRFEPGRYGLICFFPDPATGKPHFAQGMTKEFTVE